MRANGFQQLRIEVNDEQHRENISPEEYRDHEGLGVLVVREKIETACCEETL